GQVTVSGDVIEMENENAEPVLDAVNNLVEQVGGHITFTSAADGTRVINWLTEIGTTSRQTIEFGENLLDYSSSGANTTELATGIIPYGAKIEYVDWDTGELVKTNERITIKDAANSGGKDYIINGDAAFERGTIMMTKVWDDVKTANELYSVALAWLEDNKPWMFVSSLELTALDLSYMDKKIDRFTVGDMVHVVSKPHQVDAMLQITQMTEDLLDPAQSKVTLGKDIVSLTGTNVAEEKVGMAAINGMLATLGNFNLSGYATKEDLNNYASSSQMMEAVGQAQLAANAATVEALARKALVDNVEGETHVLGDAIHVGAAATVTHLYGSDRIKVHGRMHLMDGMLDFSNNEGVRCYNNDGTVVYILRTDTSNNTIVGTANNKLYLRGPTVYLGATNAVVTSDRRNKHSIEELPDAYVEALDKMVPVRFKYNDGTSDRYHVGFIAQDVEGALTEAGLCGKDFGGFVDLNGDGETLGLAYDEFIGLLFQKIRKLEKRIQVLESDNR
ncbi:MAG: phage tail protein, partial [Clostridia bacterium]|nr:phage tail protein [Clostridia bacterium]